METKELFTQKVISNRIKTIKLTSDQIKKAKEWSDMLKAGKLKDEVKNYFHFRDIILRDILGYSEREIDHENSHVEFSINDSSGKRAVCFEVKGSGTNLRDRQNRTKGEQITPIAQLWSYMYHDATPWGIATNYNEFILFRYDKGDTFQYSVKFESVSEDLNKLREFVAVFSRSSIFGEVETESLTKLIKDSEMEERIFSNEFYKLFDETRRMLIEEFDKNGLGKEERIHFAQLYLNRLMFIFFAEGYGFLERKYFWNSIRKFLDNEYLGKNTSQISYKIRNLFLDLDNAIPENIKGFNGGLFKEKIPETASFRDLREDKFFEGARKNHRLYKKPDFLKFEKEYLSKINNMSPLVKNIILMSSYDFKDEIKVDILGHIFEQSITDLEDIKEGKTSKRKADGIFYTPEYITEYICRNTIYPYLSKGGARTAKELVKEYSLDITELEEKFKNIKILDPACGSGAFLIKAVDVLLEISEEISESKKERAEFFASGRTGALGKGKVLTNKTGQLSLASGKSKWDYSEHAREIIESNIYGVDINEESIEITKLSLFLKIANKKKKLPDLSKNLRRGNSLVDSSAFAWGDKNNGFGEIVEKGGFDVVIGNPPYIRIQRISHEDIDFLKKEYPNSTHKKFDLSLVFFEKGLSLVKKGGRIGYISSSQWMSTDYGLNLRKFLLNGYLQKVVDFGSLPVFDASTYPAIFLMSRDKSESLVYIKIDDKSELSLNKIVSKKGKTVPYSRLDSSSWIFDEFNLIHHLESKKIPWKYLSLYGHFYIGALTGMDKVFVVTKEKISENKLEESLLLPYAYQADEIFPYTIISPSESIIYPYVEEGGNTVLIGENRLKSIAPNIYRYLEKNKGGLTQRKDSRKLYAQGDNWYRFLRQGSFNYIKPEKLIIRGVAKEACVGMIPRNTTFNGANCPAFILEREGYDLKMFWSIFNSKLISFYLRSVCPDKLQGYKRFNANNLNNIPIPDLSLENQKRLRSLAEKMQHLNQDFYKRKSKLLGSIRMKYTLVATSKKLGSFYEMSFEAFVSEISKLAHLKPKSALAQREIEDFWRDLFESEKAHLIQLKKEIESTSNEQNVLIYDLYGLTDKEVEVIENGLKNLK